MRCPLSVPSQRWTYWAKRASGVPFWGRPAGSLRDSRTGESGELDQGRSRNEGAGLHDALRLLPALKSLLLGSE